MKPIGNIFGFDCVTCEHNRNCYGGNMGNQFRYCQKSIEKVQNLDKLEQQNQKYKEVIDKLSSQIRLYGKYNGEKCTRGFSMMAADFNELLDILKEVE